MISQGKKTNHSALLVMDIQRTTVGFIGDDQVFLNRIAEAIDTARRAEMKILFVRVRFREGYPEVSPHNRLFSRILAAGQFTEADMEMHPAIAIQPGDMVVTKLRASAFSGSDLEVLLRSQAINHLILCGIATSGVVLSTTLEAADKDYDLTVLSDCCADRDEEVQRVLMTKIFPRYAEVTPLKDWKPEG